MSNSAKKDVETFESMIVRDKFDLFQFHDEYLRVSARISETMDLLKIQARRYSDKDATSLYSSLCERQSLSSEFLEAVHDELERGFSRFEREELECLANDLCLQMDRDEMLQQALERDLDHLPLRP